MILGVQPPKIIYNSSTILLDESIVRPAWESSEIEHVDEIGGDKAYIPKSGEYAEYSLDVYLFKYADPVAKFREIYAVNKKSVTFLPHRDGKLFRDSNGEEVLFYVTDIKLAYLAENDNRDVLQIKLKSKKLINLERTLAGA